MNGFGREVEYLIIEHMAFSADKEYKFILKEGEANSIKLYHTGNNFTVKAKFTNANIVSCKIKTRISLFKD